MVEYEEAFIKALYVKHSKINKASSFFDLSPNQAESVTFYVKRIRMARTDIEGMKGRS